MPDCSVEQYVFKAQFQRVTGIHTRYDHADNWSIFWIIRSEPHVVSEAQKLVDGVAQFFVTWTA